jgi:O-antigen/teichoic acid export membrane protein
MHSFNLYYIALLNYQGQAARRLGYILISVVLNVLLNMVLIPEYGAVGAAAAVTVSYIPYVLLNRFAVNRILAHHAAEGVAHLAK